jgi:23S rRNA pseudouridine2605 synthase
LASSTPAAAWVSEGRVRVNGQVVRDPETPVRQGVDKVTVDGMKQAQPAARCVVMLNKPRGLVTTTQDEHGRDTVYACLEGSGLPWLAPVGRLDKASEGLLLFSNDAAWAATITDPHTGPEKTYHVQVDGVPDEKTLQRWKSGVADGEETLTARSVELLRTGGKTAWLAVVLDEGKNRQIRRLVESSGLRVLRLMRVAVGGKGKWRRVTDEELRLLR